MCNILYVKGMNLSESEGDDEIEEDIWDDKKLNDAYDKALRIANAEVAKRVAMSTNTKQGDKEEHKSKKDKNRPSSSKAPQKKDRWTAGMACRTVYEVDGLEYEAFLMKIINEKECAVKFIGYDNVETVPISSLQPSLGKLARTLQMEQAQLDKADEGFTSQSPVGDRLEAGSDAAASVASTERSSQKKKKSSKKKKSNHNLNRKGYELPEMPGPTAMPSASFLRNFGVDMLLPPPPLTVPPVAGRVDSEDQAISSMLISWYMSGYYTGLYQGIKKAQGNRRN